MQKFSKSVKKFAVLAGVAGAIVALPAIAQNRPKVGTQSPLQAQAEPMTPSGSESASSMMENSIVAIADSSNSFDVLSGLLKLTGLDDVLENGTYTVFAPTDAAFGALQRETFQALLQPENRELLTEILKYHVMSGEMVSSELQSMTAETVEGSSVDVQVGSSGVMIGNAMVTQADIQGNNGVIHVINQVLVPEEIANALTSTLGANALTPRTLSDLVSSSSSRTMGTTSMGNTSMGMSSESAMGSGSTMTGDRSTMGTTSMEMGTESTMEARSTTASDSVIGVAASNDSFKILTAALRASGLDQVLAAEGPYTIFAPTDAAFAALPAGTIEQLLRPENRDLLVQVLSYHVVPGEMSSTMLESGATETVQGSPVEVVVSDTGVMVNNARVVQADIEASNGVIHAIDQVILPPDA
jgi:uncharacterized surface protein with fasciclin (FAS1) repeats